MVAGSSASETGKLLSHLGVRSFKTSLFFPLDKVCGEFQVLHPLKDEIVNALYSSAGRSGVELCGSGASEGDHIACALQSQLTSDMTGRPIHTYACTRTHTYRLLIGPATLFAH